MPITWFILPDFFNQLNFQIKKHLNFKKVLRMYFSFALVIANRARSFENGSQVKWQFN